MNTDEDLVASLEYEELRTLAGKAAPAAWWDEFVRSHVGLEERLSRILSLGVDRVRLLEDLSELYGASRVPSVNRTKIRARVQRARRVRDEVGQLAEVTAEDLTPETLRVDDEEGLSRLLNRTLIETTIAALSKYIEVLDRLHSESRRRSQVSFSRARNALVEYLDARGARHDDVACLIEAVTGQPSSAGAERVRAHRVRQARAARASRQVPKGRRRRRR